MATRRTSVPERIAGDILGFTTGAEVEESKSVLAKYFPELSLRIPAKGARGGRLGRAPQTAEQTIKYTPQEMLRGGAPVTNISVTAPAQQPATQGPDYTSQIDALKQQLFGQSKQIEKLLKGREKTETKIDEPKKPFVPQTAEEQAREQITKLYRDVLGREPEAEGMKSWMSEGRALGGITPEEYTSLERDFKLSPEYNVLKLYREELGRTDDPRIKDPEGFKYWTTQDPRSGDRMITSQEYGELQQAFRATPEYKQKQEKAPPTGGTTAPTFGTTGQDTVSKAYQAAFGRSADAPGLQYWNQQLQPGTSVETVKSQLIESAKQAAPTSEDRVRIAYQEALGRAPDPEGLKFWSTSAGTSADFNTFKNQLRAAAGLA